MVLPSTGGSSGVKDLWEGGRLWGIYKRGWVGFLRGKLKDWGDMIWGFSFFHSFHCFLFIAMEGYQLLGVTTPLPLLMG